MIICGTIVGDFESSEYRWTWCRWNGIDEIIADDLEVTLYKPIIHTE